jgi:hypothetical protein
MTAQSNAFQAIVEWLYRTLNWGEGVPADGIFKVAEEDRAEMEMVLGQLSFMLSRLPSLLDQPFEPPAMKIVERPS